MLLICGAWVHGEGLAVCFAFRWPRSPLRLLGCLFVVLGNFGTPAAGSGGANLPKLSRVCWHPFGMRNVLCCAGTGGGAALDHRLTAVITS
jgi:hypothetical protein